MAVTAQSVKIHAKLIAPHRGKPPCQLHRYAFAGEWNPTMPRSDGSPVENFAADQYTTDDGATAYDRMLHKVEKLSESVTNAVSSPWGTLTALIFLVVGSILFVSGPSRLSTFAEQMMTMLSLALLFLLQRSQTKATLSLQIKLNELLRSVQESDNHLINVERLSEEELKQLHDRYQELHDERRQALKAESI
jgi:low affinity Fe/Cu permease